MRKKILGPPGTGKTTRALHLMGQEIAAGVRPNQIAFITFTKRGIQEAVDRVVEQFGYGERDVPYFRTLHSICYRVMQLSQDRVLNGRRVKEFAKFASLNLSDHFEAGDEDSAVTEDDRILSWMHTVRARLRTYEEAFKNYGGQKDWHYVNFVIQSYDTYRKANYLLDFTDFLTLYLSHGKPLPVRVLFVDEAQDLSPLQWKVVELMAQKAERVYVIGDDDQAIFSWSGADASSFIHWKTDETEVLPKSWRLPRTVHKLAQTIIHRVHGRLEKEFAPTDRDGRVSWIENTEEVEAPKTGSAMVLYRNHFLGWHLEEDLRFNGVPYLGRRSPFREPDELMAIINWQRFIEGKPMTVGLLSSAIQLIPSNAGIITHGTKSKFAEQWDKSIHVTKDKAIDFGIKQLKPWGESLLMLKQKETIERLIDKGGLDVLSKKPNLVLSTIHQAKGGEADRVYLMTDMGYRTYAHYEREPDDEHRVFYVGVTRAKHELVLVDNMSSKYYDL